MTTPTASTSSTDFSSALRAVQRAYDSAGAQARLDIERRLRGLSRHVADSVSRLEHAARDLQGVRGVMAVQEALDASDQRFRELLKTELAGLDFSAIWPALWGVAKEVALYIGGGAVLGGAVGGVLGSLGGGVGAFPGALAGGTLGANIGGEILVWMGLAQLIGHIGETMPAMCRKMAEGFASAWEAGRLPDNARGQRPALMRQSIDAFATGKMMLIKAILAAIVVYLSRGQVSQSMLVAQLSKSKLGPKFAEWVAANRDQLIKHPALQRKIAAAEAEAGAGAGAGTARAPGKAASPEPAQAKAGKAEPAKQEGKAKEPCPACLLVGAPVNPVSGSKILAGDSDLDFALPAALALVWQRTYSSAQRQAGWLGQGWATPISDALKVGVDDVVVLDAFQRDITFSLPRVGESRYSPSEKLTLARSAERNFELIDQDGLRTQFAVPATASATAGDIARLVGLMDANGNRISIEYNQRQLPERIEDSAGRAYLLDFADVRGHPRLRSIALLADASVEPGAEPALLVRYDYDAAGNLVQVRNRLGEITREYAYRNHVMIEHCQPGGLVSRYEYDEYAASGKVTRNWTNNGLSWSFRYRAQETIVTDNLGREQRYRFDSERRFVGQVDAAGGVTTRRLDSDGNLLAITDPGGRSTGYRYDQRGRLIRVESKAEGASASTGTGIVYDTRFDKPALITDALGATTALRYDEHGNLLSVTDALGQRTAYQYDDRGLPVHVRDAAGGVKRLAYNRAAQLITYTDCSGNSTHFSYDHDGRLVRATDANGNATRYAYDAIGRLLSAVQPDGATERYEYDGLGRLLARIDAAGKRTQYELDSDGKPLKRIDARGGVLAYRYDDARRMAELINENGEVHRFVYDALDRLTEETGFDARLTRYRYDDSGLVVAKEEHGSGVRTELTRIDTSYLRDGMGQLVEKIIARTTGEAQAEQLRLRFAYDSVGRMTQAINADADVALRYDAIGQLLEEETRAGMDITVLRHAYDELGNRIRTVLPDGRVLNNLFYGSGHLHQINLDGEVITDIERDRTHQALSRSQGALTSRFRYDAAGRLLSQVAALGTLMPGTAAGQIGTGEGAAPVIARDYQYDAAGNLLSIDDRRHGRTTYSYDVIGRILSAVQPQSDERFAFDPAHNLLDATVAGVGRVEGNRVRVFEDKRYDYDAHGNVSEKLVGRHTRMRFVWNAAHQLVKAVVTRHAQTGQDTQPVVQTVKYGYDPFGRRISKRDAFGVTRFGWDGNRLLCERRGSYSRTYVYNVDSFIPLAQFHCDQISGGTNGRAEVQHLHTDHLGTPRELTDSSGRILWEATYAAWGNVLTVSRGAARLVVKPAAWQEAVDLDQPIRFQGQYHDVETGLHYNRFRYYDPDIGRFASQDPIGLSGGNNLMRYASNPTGWIDPLGLSPCGPCPGKVIKNSLEPHELKFAEEIVAYQGGVLEGAASRGFPGDDGKLSGTLISLKETEGSLAAVLKHASAAERKAANAGYAHVDLYIKAVNVDMASLRDFAAKGPLSKIPAQGTISNIHVLTKDGWILFGK